MKYIDLHVHSNFSDGTQSPSELVFRASDLGLAAIALTDHDTLAGIPEALSAAESLEQRLTSLTCICVSVLNIGVHLTIKSIVPHSPILCN